ncbi:MAG: hypothetical protein U5L06_01765 [Rhodovibrio sp.]|nr:hypothetical protein [Rhodovibrio sp.]
MSDDISSLVFLVYARSHVRLELDEALLTANAGRQIHLITTETVTFAIQNGDPERARVVVHRYRDRTDITEGEVHDLIARVLDGRELPIHVTSLSESTVELVGRVNLRLGLAERDYGHFVHKDRMKQEAAALGVRTPRYHVWDRRRFLDEGPAYLKEVMSDVGLPCFVKPTNLYGGIGTRMLETRQAIHDWALQRRYDAQRYECDEYIDWPIYQCDSIVCQGVTEFCQVSVGSRPWADIYGGHNVGIRTLHPDDPLRARLTAVAERINAGFLNGGSGVTCLELFVTAEDVVFLEIGYRPAGAGMASSPYYRQSQNVHLNEAHVLAQVDPTWRPRPTFRSHVAWVVVPQPMGEGVLARIVMPSLDCQTQMYWNVDVGSPVGANAGLDRYAGAFLLWSDCYTSLTESYQRVLDECRLELVAAHV